MRKLVCVLAVRNQGTRLYAKPMQNLDTSTRYSILDYMTDAIRRYPSVQDLILAVGAGAENAGYFSFAEKRGIKSFEGDEEDVLLRLIRGAELTGATDVFRVTSESPFTYFEIIESAWKRHVECQNDMTSAEFLPDGCGFEILNLEALKKSHRQGEKRHRSELCTLYMRENKDQFRIEKLELPKIIQRLDLRLTVDNPEDLIVCRNVYSEFKHLAPMIPLDKIIKYLDGRPELRSLVSKYVEPGLQTMYL